MDRAAVEEDAACPVCGAEASEHLRHDPDTCARRSERRAALQAMKAEIEQRERDLAEAQARYRDSPERREETREYGEAYAAEHEAEHGPIPQEALDAAAAALGIRIEPER